MKRITPPAAQTQNQVKRGFLLNVVIDERAPVFKLLSRKNQPLLVGRNAFLILNFRLHILHRIRGFNFKRDRLPSQRFDKNLHSE